MKQRINFIITLYFAIASTSEVTAAPKRHLKDSIGKMLEEVSVWETPPVESESVNVQILDKISGKVFRKNLDLNKSIEFGTVRLFLEKAFVNSPDDAREVYALIKIEEKNKEVFRNWLFASSPSVNFFSHPVYEVRVEF